MTVTTMKITTTDFADHTRQVAVEMFDVICLALSRMPDMVTANEAAEYLLNLRDQLAARLVVGLDQEVAKMEDQA